MAIRKLAFLAATAIALAGCNPDGSVNWGDVGAITLGVGLAAAAGAEASRPQPAYIVVTPRVCGGPYYYYYC